MAITNDQRKALEAMGYTVGKSGNTVMNSKGQTVAGFNANGNIFSGNSKITEILKMKPAAAAPKPAAQRAAQPAASNAPSTSPRPKPRPAAPASVSKPATKPDTPMPARAAGLSTPPVPGRRSAPAMGGAKAEERMAPARKPDAPMPARAAGLATPTIPGRSGSSATGRTPAPTRRTPNSTESFQENYDIMGNAYRKGGVVKAAVGGMIDPKSMTSGQKTKAKAMMAERGATPRGLTKAYYSSGRAFSKGGKVK